MSPTAAAIAASSSATDSGRGWSPIPTPLNILLERVRLIIPSSACAEQNSLLVLPATPTAHSLVQSVWVHLLLAMFTVPSFLCAKSRRARLMRTVRVYVLPHDIHHPCLLGQSGAENPLGASCTSLERWNDGVYYCESHRKRIPIPPQRQRPPSRSSA